jgi:hypothetical protein
MPLHLTAIVAGVLFTMVPFLTGCGGGQAGSDPTVTVPHGSGEAGSTPPVLATASLAWSPVQDPSVSAYIVHYGRLPQVNRVAAHMKVPCMLPYPQPRLQTLIPIPSTTLR